MPADLAHPPLAGAGRRPAGASCSRTRRTSIALGFGSGLSPVAPGTVGTLWAWLVYAVLRPLLDDARCGAVIVGARCCSAGGPAP